MRRVAHLSKIVIVSLTALFLSTSIVGTAGVGPTAHAVICEPDYPVLVTTFLVDGVEVNRYAKCRIQSRPPVVMVHGGAHGSWVFDRIATILAEADFHVFTLNWLNHGGSTALIQAEWINRGIAAVAHREIRSVTLNRLTPIVIGHSMGGLAALEYAANYPVHKLVLMAPVVPASIGAPPIEIEVDLTQPFPVFPYEVARQLFFPTLTETEAQSYYARLQPESPRAVWEATRWTVPVNLASITAPTLAISAGNDPLVPASVVAQLAAVMGAELRHYDNVGHSDLLLAPAATTIAGDVRSWLLQ